MHEARITFVCLFKRLCSFFYIACSHIHTTKYSVGHEVGKELKSTWSGVRIWLSKRAVFPSQTEYSTRGLILSIKNWLDREQWALDIRKEPAVDVSLWVWFGPALCPTPTSSVTANSSLHTDRCLHHPSHLGWISKTANDSQLEPI